MASAVTLANVSDTLSNQSSGVVSNHTIVFEATDGIVLGETIVFTYTGFNASSISAADINVLVGGSTTGSRVLTSDWSFNLLSSTELEFTFTASQPAGTYAEIRVGNHAGTNQIVNPNSSGSYFVTISGSLIIGKGGIMIPIINDNVSIFAKIIEPPTTTTNPTSSGGTRCRFGSCLFDDNENDTLVTLIGWSHYNGLIEVYHDGRLLTITSTDATGFFSIELQNFITGDHSFTLIGVDDNGLRTPLDTYTVSLTYNTTHIVSDIILPPTIENSFLKNDGSGHLHGDTIPFATIDLYRDGVFIGTVIADSTGHWDYDFFGLNPDQYYLFSAVARIYGLTSDTSFFQSVWYTNSIDKYQEPIEEFITTTIDPKTNNEISVTYTPENLCLVGDISTDGHVSLQDLSILAYWRSSDIENDIEKNIRNNRESWCLDNKDNSSFSDFSIIAYYWDQVWEDIIYVREELN